MWRKTRTVRAACTLNADKTLTTDQQLYWTSTDPTTVTAWYSTNETVDLSDQSNGLVYVLKATAENATYDNKITLGFKHQLAKVRVVLNGTQASLAQSVEVYGCTTCTNNEGATVIDGSTTQGWIKMKKQLGGQRSARCSDRPCKGEWHRNHPYHIPHPGSGGS